MSAQVAADLRAAADVLERDGWTRGAWLDEGRRCVAGALTKAVMDLHPDDNFDRAYQSAHDTLSGHLGTAPMLWNDAHGRTAAEVIAALRAAADRAEADQ